MVLGVQNHMWSGLLVHAYLYAYIYLWFKHAVLDTHLCYWFRTISWSFLLVDVSVREGGVVTLLSGPGTKM